MKKGISFLCCMTCFLVCSALAQGTNSCSQTTGRTQTSPKAAKDSSSKHRHAEKKETDKKNGHGRDKHPTQEEEFNQVLKGIYG